MRVPPLRRPTIQVALLLGFGLVVGLWAYTGYEFTTRMAAVEEASAEITARYVEAQDRLTRVRSQLLVASVFVRDALLEPVETLMPRYERQLDETYDEIDAALSDYEPVLDTAAQRVQVERMRREVNDFRLMTAKVMAARHGGATDVRELLNRNLVPRREAAVRVSEEVQALNRTEFIRHQTDISRVHRTAERRTWQQVGLALLASLGIGAFFSVYAGRLEARVQQQLERNQRSTRDLQYLSSRLISTQEEERRTVARELHDEVGQALTAVQVELAVAERRLKIAGHASVLGDAQAMTHSALQTVRDMSHLLHPAVLEDLGLAAAVEWQARTFEVRHGIPTEVHQDASAHRFAREVELTAYRIVQEALTNVARHSAATTCSITLQRGETDLEVTIEDNGRGFDVAEAGERRGLGLVGMRERAAVLSGVVTLASECGGGTRVRVRLPIGGVAHA